MASQAGELRVRADLAWSLCAVVCDISLNGRLALEESCVPRYSVLVRTWLHEHYIQVCGIKVISFYGRTVIRSDAQVFKQHAMTTCAFQGCQTEIS